MTNLYGQKGNRIVNICKFYQNEVIDYFIIKINMEGIMQMKKKKSFHITKLILKTYLSYAI